MFITDSYHLKAIIPQWGHNKAGDIKIDILDPLKYMDSVCKDWTQ